MQRTLAAHAKVNFILDVLGRRPNGYHDVAMLMVRLSLHDRTLVVFASDHGEAFGEQRLTDICAAQPTTDPESLVQRVVESVQNWTGDPEPGDDLTLLALQT